MVDHLPKRIRYSRVADGLTAGTVAIEVLDSGKAATQVRITYDLTALGPAGERWLEAFDAGYQTEIAARESEIAAALEQPQ
jgi:hypothetical protein